MRFERHNYKARKTIEETGSIHRSTRVISDPKSNEIPSQLTFAMGRTLYEQCSEGLRAAQVERELHHGCMSHSGLESCRGTYQTFWSSLQWSQSYEFGTSAAR